MSRQIPLVHPGIILLQDWFTPMNISQYALAKAIAVPPRRTNEIVKALRGITVDTALALILANLEPHRMNCKDKTSAGAG